MSDDKAKGKEPPPRLVLTFDGTPGDVTITHEGNVSTGMVYAAAWQLDTWAREMRMAALTMEARSRLNLGGSPADLLAQLGLDGLGGKPPGATS